MVPRSGATTFTLSATADTCAAAVEIATDGMSVENNTFVYPSCGVIITKSSGTELEHNTFLVPTRAQDPISPSPPCSFCADRGFRLAATFWIGTNTIDGGPVTGCGASKAVMGDIDIPAGLEFFHAHGKHCDCEILCNVDLLDDDDE